MAEAGDRLTDDEKQPVLDAIAALESVLGSDDQEEIEAKTKALTDASAKIAEKLYAAADAGAQATDAGGRSADDDVVDAEFEEVKDDEKKS